MSGTSDVDVGSKNWPENRYTQKYRVEVRARAYYLSVDRSVCFNLSRNRFSAKSYDT